MSKRQLAVVALGLFCVLGPVILSAQDLEPARSGILAWHTSAFDFNRHLYHRNRLEVSLESGYMPHNIPFVFDRLVGIPDRLTGLNYTLQPNILSLRWQMSDVGGWWIFRGNWDMSFGGTYTMIPRGPETRFFAYVMGIRRNFVQPNWKIIPYFEGRAGVGDINAKQPYGAIYAQGQDLTFTVMLDAGARYNITPRYAFGAGAGYMHISNLYLSEPKYLNYGINVWGPMFGVYMTLGHHGETRPTAEKDKNKDKGTRVSSAGN